MNFSFTSRINKIILVYIHSRSLSSNRHHLSCDDCLNDKREDLANIILIEAYTFSSIFYCKCCMHCRLLRVPIKTENWSILMTL